MLTTKSSRWSAAAAAVCVLLMVATWFLFISPRRSEAADLRGQTSERQQQNERLRTQIASLKAQFAELPMQQARLAAIKLEMPEDQQQAALVRKLDDLAASAGVSMESYTQGTPAPVMAAAGATAAAGAAASTPLPAGVQLFYVPTTLTINGDYFAIARFVKRLQTGLTRAFLVTGLNVTVDSTGADGEVTVALTGQLYVLRTDGSIGMTSPAPTPTATSSRSLTPTPTPTGSPTPSPTGSATATPTTTP